MYTVYQMLFERNFKYYVNYIFMCLAQISFQQIYITSWPLDHVDCLYEHVSWNMKEQLGCHDPI